MADGKLQLLSYLPCYIFVPRSCVIVFVFAIPSLLNKNAHASLFLSQSKKLIRRYSMCIEAYLRFSFSKRVVYVCVCVFFKNSRHSFVVPLIISLCEIHKYPFVCTVHIIILKRERSFFLLFPFLVFVGLHFFCSVMSMKKSFVHYLG